jgi:hypothetical protein
MTHVSLPEQPYIRPWVARPYRDKSGHTSLKYAPKPLQEPKVRFTLTAIELLLLAFVLGANVGLCFLTFQLLAHLTLGHP